MLVRRDVEEDLLRWKNQKQRLPLLVRGARQVGKTYVIEQFGQREFEQYVKINFELSPELKQCFVHLDPKKIVEAIELVTGHLIIPGKTLLFLDEIQECPKAIVALRYFKEEMSELHVVGAGSLLEFALHDVDFRMPVGRVQFLYIRPLSFGEYLEACGHASLRKHLQTIRIGDEIQDVVHDKLLNVVRQYFALGGMPAAISLFLETKSLLQVQERQSALLLTYRKDFGKYAGRTPHHHLENLFSKAPGFVGQWLKYTTIDPDVAPSTLKTAIKKLCDAGLLVLVHATSAAGLPLVTHKNEKKCKMFFLDVGLVKRACHLDLELLFQENPFLVNKGALAEQFVGQELLAYLGKQEEETLFSWVREERNSSAEIDYLIAVGSFLVPIEVKASSLGSLRSLKIFLKEKNIPIGVRISEKAFSFESSILSLPFYMVEQLPRLIREVYAKNEASP
ncbi:MAG: ATP-binding protein [Chlamydiae bacterium]|nr:ATP-binding protein [Chlamydiota bacterium]